MSERPSWDQTFIEILHVIAKRSCCVKYQISAILVRDKQIISMGYNGTFPGKSECMQHWLDYHRKHIEEPYESWIVSEKFRQIHSEWSKNNELHAESNVLSAISKKEIMPMDVLYTMYAPCENCAKLIVYHGIKNVKYIHDYSRPDGINILRDNGINVTKLA